MDHSVALWHINVTYVVCGREAPPTSATHIRDSVQCCISKLTFKLVEYIFDG